MASVKSLRPLPALPEGWSAESNFIAHGPLSSSVHRKLEPVGPHFLAHARRVRRLSHFRFNFPGLIANNPKQKRHSRTFSEDDRIQASQNVKNVEDDDVGEISEPESPLLLQRDPKDWKVSMRPVLIEVSRI